MFKFPFVSPGGLPRQASYGFVLGIPLLAGFASSSHLNQDLLPRSNADAQHSFKLVQAKEGEGSSPVQSGQKEKEYNPLKNVFQQEKEESRVQISEVVIEGLEGHPEEERLQFSVYDAMKIRPGSSVSRKQLKIDLDSVYSTGWFSGVRIEPINGPLGVQLLVDVTPNPVLTKVEIIPANVKLPPSLIKKVFDIDYGKTLNLNSLKSRLRELKDWYVQEGYSLARISGPNRVTKEGVIQLKVVEGTVAGVDVQFLNKDGESQNEDGSLINGKTRKWVVEREISIKPNDIFNRNLLENDIKRLYSTSLFSDVKVTLRPVPGETGKVTIVLGITEQSTGSLTGGIGYSQGQGAFGQIGLGESNLLGRAWNTNINVTYGQFGGLVNFTFSDPWIKGDPHRTSLRTSLFISREIPQEFRSQTGGSIRSVSDYYDSGSESAYDIGSNLHGKGGPFSSISSAKNHNSNISWFDNEGDSVALQRTGGGFSFSRPLNGGNPYKKVPWNVLLGANVQDVQAVDYAGKSRPYGVLTDNFKNGSAPNNEVICVAFNCAEKNTLLSVRTAATYNTLNDPRNPTSGNFWSVGTEQFVSVGEDSPTFNRAKTGYSFFFPVNWLKISKGCRPKSGEKAKCPQTIGFQIKAGAIVGELPPYEAFCVGGSSSVRGWNSCDLAVGRNFGEASVEYRFPIWKLLAGALFVDGGTDFGSQQNVPGKPGKLLGKDGSGFSLGSGLIINTPVGPLRLEAASRDMSGEWRYNLGVGWKF